jgi:uncharacterized protein (TIGR03435 family)
MKLIFTLLALLPALALAEDPDNRKFEVADIHNSPRATQPFVRGPFFSTSRYELRFATMLDLIRIAYNVDPEKVTGGPTWLEMDRFDVFAKTASASNAETRRVMLQALLAERFGLKTHTGSQPMPVYALTAGKHSGLKEADSSGEPGGCKFEVQNAPTGPPAPGTPIQLPTIVYTCKNTGMATLATNMLNVPGAAQYFNNRLVVDKTELTGNWDFSFHFTPKVPAGIQTTGEVTPIFDAIEKQLGLKLDLANVPMPVIVVDSVNRKPTPNSEEAMKSFPPLPTEFEVASLKPVDSGATGGGRGGAQPQPDIKNGRLYLPNFPLKVLIQVAWELNGDEFLINAPSWLDSDKYEILAKAPANVAIGDLTPNRNIVPVNIDAIRPMLRALLTERFQIKAHMEERPLNAYNLVAKSPKLKKADPDSRTRWQEGALPDTKPGKNANTQLGRLVNCQNVTMAQFAELLPGIAPGYLRTEVKDATGLEGGYDFTFSFSPVGVLNLNRSRGPANSDNPNSEASDPTMAVSLFDAVEKQLGLKLELQKRPTPVLVIDHIERKPIEN